MTGRNLWRVLASTMALGAGCVALCGPVRAARAPEPHRIDVVAKRFAFAPAEISVKRGEPVVLSLQSEDVAHGIKVEELGIAAEIGKGKTTELPFTPQTPGTFVGHCSHFCGTGHGEMTLTIHVTE